MDHFLVESGVELGNFFSFRVGSLEVLSAAIFRMLGTYGALVIVSRLWLDADHKCDGSQI